MSYKFIMDQHRLIVNTPSSYVLRNIKLKGDTGNGEAKLHIGPTSSSAELNEFFNYFSNENTYTIDKYSVVSFLKSNREQFLDKSKYKNVDLKYYNEKLEFWETIKNEDLVFNLIPYTDKSRFYIRENLNNLSKYQVFYKKLREVCLPEISSIVIDKNENHFTFRLVQYNTVTLDTVYLTVNNIDYDSSSKNNDLNDQEDIYNVIKEGSQKYFLGKKYERNQKLRKKAIEIHGVTCKACSFNFENTYGEIGKNYIEIHHKTPLSTTGEVSINPETDLIPLCSNCHRMVHRNKHQVLSVEDLVKMIKNK